MAYLTSRRNKIVPAIGRFFGKKFGVEYGMGPIAKTMGVGLALNTLTGLSEGPPLHFFGAQECECEKIRQNIKNKMGNVGHVVSGMFM